MAATHEQYITDKKGNKSAIILPLEEYNELIEDIHDLAMVAERKDDDGISFAEIKKRLK
jgi:PHD/YefM family antitoxin component YafN of YafNO toxin-antitoxin module